MTLIDRDKLLEKFQSGALLFQPDVRKIIENEPEVIVRCTFGKFLECCQKSRSIKQCKECGGWLANE